MFGEQNSACKELHITCIHPTTHRTLQVCELIEAMGLGQYKKRFMEEHISGEILLECDEQVLQDELGIQSKIHRIRLMKVITGLHSSKTILDNKK